MLLDPESYRTAAWLFVRGIAVTSAVAFLSLLVQLRGLYGRDGILPIAEVAGQLRARGARPWTAPTVFLLGAGDTALLTVAGVGLVASVLATVDVLTVPALLVAWACYLSFSTVGRDFLSFQWDVLLVETMVVAAVMAATRPPPEPALWLGWFLLFRLLFQSGVAKLLSRDETWRDGTALAYHHETQPLPTRFAWYAHQLPRAVHVATTWTVLALEIAVPLLLVAPWPWRAVPLGLLLILQVGILLSGNYGFFNLLAIVLHAPLIPDRVWAPLVGHPAGVGGASPAGSAGWWVASAVAVTLLALNAVRLATTAGEGPRMRSVLRVAGRFRLANRYGLFAVMTTTRPEIVVEGSPDGTSWTAYRFRYKPVDPRRPPRWNAPHQPRLDWQLWFAALGTLDRNRWFLRFLERLLAGHTPVARLLAEGPDPRSPPRFVRARLFRYSFTDRATRRTTGRWWDREAVGSYCPPLALRDGDPVPASRRGT